MKDLVKVPEPSHGAHSVLQKLSIQTSQFLCQNYANN